MQSCQDPLKKVQKNTVGKLMEDDIFGSFSGNFAGETENLKMHSCFCPDGMFQTEIDPWYQFQTFSVVFWLKGTGTKFTSPFRQARVLRRAAYEAYEWYAPKFLTNRKASR